MSVQVERTVIDLSAGRARTDVGRSTARPANIPSQWEATHVACPFCGDRLYRHAKGAPRQRSGRVIRIESETASEQVALIEPFPRRTHLALKCRREGCEVALSITHRKFKELLATPTP